MEGPTLHKGQHRGEGLCLPEPQSRVFPGMSRGGGPTSETAGQACCQMWEVSYELVRNLSPQTEGAWCSEVWIFISHVPAFPTVELNLEGEELSISLPRQRKGMLPPHGLAYLSKVQTGP